MAKHKLIEANIKKIISLHNEITESLKTSLEKAILIGQLLIEQKEKLKHGEFTSWIKENLPFTGRTARNYIKLFNNKDMLITERVSDLTAAYKLLSTPPSRLEENKRWAYNNVPAEELISQLPEEGERVLLLNKSELAFCIAIGPYPGYPYLQTADFKCDEVLFNKIRQIKDQQDTIELILDLYNAGDIECSGIGTWGNYYNGISVQNFIRGPVNGWHKTGLEHGIPKHFFKTDIDIIYKDFRTDENKHQQHLDYIDSSIARLEGDINKLEKQKEKEIISRLTG